MIWPWTAADLVGIWTQTREDNTWVQRFDLQYEADGTCAWQERFDDSANPRRNRVDFYSGTCELDFTEHFLFVNVDMVDGRRYREPLEGHRIRIAFTRGYGEQIISSPLWQEQEYAPLEGEWRDSFRSPHGRYVLWLNKSNAKSTAARR